MKLSELKQDLGLEEDGVEVKLPCGVTVRVARLTNSRARARTDRLQAPFKYLTRAGKEIPRDEGRRITVDVIAHEVLKAWDLEEEDGTPIEYTPQRAMQVLSAEHYRDFLNEVIEAASYRETFARQELEDAEKNSGGPPAGSSSGGLTSSDSEA